MTDRCTARFMTEESWEISAIIFSHVRSIKIIGFGLKMKRGKQIQSGNFQYSGQAGDEIKELELGAVSMKYVIDSKKYYQPV